MPRSRLDWREVLHRVLSGIIYIVRLMSHSDALRRLNEEFYANTPTTYFRDRLHVLILRGANPDLIEENVGEGTVWGSLRIHPDPQPEDPAEASAKKEDEHTRFLVAESQVLLHHAAEALLRMYLAHESHPECPWLEIAALKEPGVFGKELAELAQPTWSEDRENAAGWVFLGGVPDDPHAEWTEARDAAVRLLRLLAAQVNDDSQLYNAAKHGFTALSGSGSMSIRPVEQEPEDTEIFLKNPYFLTADGVNVTYLEREGKRKTGYDWYHKTQWLNPEKDAALAHLVIIQMEALWNIARYHYLGEPPPGSTRLVSNQDLDALPDPRSGSIGSMRRYVVTEVFDRTGDAGTD